MKKLTLIGLFSLAATLGVAALITVNNNVFPLESDVEGYSLTLDSSNCGFIPDSRSSGQSNNSNSPTTSKGNRIAFYYTYAMKQNGYAMNLNGSNGSIANVTPLTGLFSVLVNYVGGQCQLSYGNSYNNYTSSINIQSGVRYEINYVTHFKITAIGSASTNISNITARYSCGPQGDLSPTMTHTHHGYHYLAKEPTSSKPGNKEFYACDECQYVSLVKEDDGNYIDAVLAYSLPTNHIAYLAPLYNLHHYRLPLQLISFSLNKIRKVH